MKESVTYLHIYFAILLNSESHSRSRQIQEGLDWFELMAIISTNFYHFHSLEYIVRAVSVIRGNTNRGMRLVAGEGKY